MADLAAASLASGYSRLPVHGGDLDDVLGVALAKDVLRVAPEARATTPVTDLMQPVPAVPLTARLDRLLSEMRATGKQLVLVVDEYGGTVGILTLEDLLEEIVGEIEDEHDVPELTPPAPPGLTVLDGGLNLDELAEAVGLDLPEGDDETLAGFPLPSWTGSPRSATRWSGTGGGSRCSRWSGAAWRESSSTRRPTPTRLEDGPPGERRPCVGEGPPLLAMKGPATSHRTEPKHVTRRTDEPSR